MNAEALRIKISAVILAKDEQDTIAEIVGKAKNFADEVLVVDGHSQDRTRELAEQINEAFKQLAQFTKIRTATVYGGVAMGPQERALKTGAEVIVACPGRLLDHIERGTINLSEVEVVVLDEADRMLDMGFVEDIEKIVSYGVMMTPALVIDGKVKTVGKLLTVEQIGKLLSE